MLMILILPHDLSQLKRSNLLHNSVIEINCYWTIKMSCCKLKWNIM